MNDEKTDGGNQGWSEGGPVEGMTGAEARAEIKAIEGDPSFAGDGKMPHWSRQDMLKRRDNLYRQGYPEKVGKPHDNMAETLKKQGVTKESLERDIEKFEVRDDKEEKDKVMATLTTYFGGEKETEAAIKSARGVIKRFAKPADLVFLEETKLGNDPELIQKLSEIGQLLQRGGKKKR